MIVNLADVIIHCTYSLYSFTVLIHCTLHTALIHCTHSDVVTSAFKQPSMAAMCSIRAVCAEADTAGSG
jgi:hypothetical protein